MASLVPPLYSHATASSSGSTSSAAVAPPSPLSAAVPSPRAPALPTASASGSSAAAPHAPAMSAPSLSTRSEEASSSRLPAVSDDASAQSSTASAGSSSRLPVLRTAISDASLGSSSAPASPAAGLPSDARADARRQLAAPAAPAAEQEAAARRSRRVMPARLMRVSSMLVGSAVEDELLGGVEGKIESPFLPASTSIFLSSEQPKLAYETSAPGEAAFSFFSDPEVARSCRMREQIETPDYKPWDDSEMLGKTRALKSTEDMSDAAYEKRHRRPDKLEKRQRRLEKERLIKDRQKLRDRIEHLKTADARLLLPIIMAREQSKAEAASGEAQSPAGASLAEPGSSTPRGTSPHSGESSASSSAKLEQLRSELLAEAHETLARYDALLPAEPSLSGASELRKRLHHDEDSDSDGALSPSGRASTSAGGHRRGAPAAASPLSAAPAAPSPVIGQRRLRLSLGPPPRTPGSSEAAASSSEPRRRSAFVPPAASPKPSPRRVAGSASSPGSSETVHVECRAENPNIHARTSGGRFAPKSAIGKVVPPRATPKKQPAAAAPEAKRSGRISGSASNTPSTSSRPMRAARRSAGDMRERLETESSSEEEVDTKPREASGSSSRAERAARPPRDVSRASEPSMAVLLHQQRQAANKTGPSLAELDASTRRPKRVKLTFSRNGRPSSSATDEKEPRSSSSSSMGVDAAPAPLAAGALLPARILPTLASAHAAAADSAESSDVEMELAPSFGASALTLEQAQALMEAAMADASSAVASPVHRPPESETGAETAKSEAHASLPAAQSAASPLPSASAAIDSTPVATAVAPADAEMSDAVEQDAEPAAPLEADVAPPAAVSSSSAPAARTSSRVKAASAFGEKIPEQASRREDFDVAWHTQLQRGDWLPDAAMAEAGASRDSAPPAHLNGAVKLEQHDDAAAEQPAS